MFFSGLMLTLSILQLNLYLKKTFWQEVLQFNSLIVYYYILIICKNNWVKLSSIHFLYLVVLFRVVGVWNLWAGNNQGGGANPL